MPTPIKDNGHTGRTEKSSGEPQAQAIVESGKPRRVYICDRCGSRMNERQCKVICPNCGSQYDCSDLTLYFE